MQFFKTREWVEIQIQKEKRLTETLRIQLRLSKSVQVRFYPVVLDYSGRNKNKHTM